MTRCLFKALKAVDLQNHAELFRLLGYDSAGALAHFRNDHFKQLNLSKQELLRFHALLDVLKEATREGKICPHYSSSHKQTTFKLVSNRSKSTEHIRDQNSQSNKINNFYIKKQSNDSLKTKRSLSSVQIKPHLSSSSLTSRSHTNGFTLQRPTSTLVSESKNNDQQFFGPKSFSNRAPVQHVKVRSYNYGVPTNNRQRNTTQRVHYQNESSSNHATIFTSSLHGSTDVVTYAKPAEIYVYARKRPLLTNETNLQDIISVPDNKRIIIAENKANLDCTPLLKKTEFQFDEVFASEISNKQIFDYTVLPFLSANDRHDLTYICFGQTGSGKSHTIFGSRNTDGLLVHCAQLLLQEINLKAKLVCSFFEIYNNQLYDLSNTGKRLFAREDGEHSVNIVGLTEIVLRNLDTLRSVINDGLSRRHHGKSAFNSNSSRSHAIFQIILKNNYNQADNFKLVFIDLAGSERATDAQNNQRKTRREGAQINSSLLALKECIRSMDMTHTHAPFRQSKLTHILRDSLVGTKTRTCLMANVSPAEDCCQCSLNTLQYASRIRDISIRHRHRSVPVATVQRNHSNKPFVRDESQRIFEPATASTPLHRQISSVDHQTYMAINQTGLDTHKRAMTRSPNTDWQLVDDDVPISGSGDNLRMKSVLSSTREFTLNADSNNQNQSSSFYLTRYEQPRKKHQNQEESPSSYFPPPQADIKKPFSSPAKEINTKQEWKTVPAPTTTTIRHASESSSEPLNSTRMIPVAPLQMSDDNQYSSATGTESLGTKITKLATATHHHKALHRQSNGIENLNLNKQSDPGTTTTITTDTEQGLYSDRQATHRDQTGFFSYRDDPLYSNDPKYNQLSTIAQRTSPTTTPKHAYQHYKSDAISSSSRKSFTSPSKSHHRSRYRKSLPTRSSSSSSSGSLRSNNNEKQRYSSVKRHHRAVPYNTNYSPNFDHNQYHRKTYSTRNEACQTVNDIRIMKNEQEQTDDQFLLEQFPDQPSANLIQASVDPVNHLHHENRATSPLSKSLLPMKTLFGKDLKRNETLPLNDHLGKFRRTRTDLTPVVKSNQTFSSSSNYGIRVSEQLNTLRSLLEKRLMEQDEFSPQAKDSSTLQTSPKTFTKEFLQSYQLSKYKNDSNEIISDLDDDDDDNQYRQIKMNLSYYDQNRDRYRHETLSPSFNQREYLLNSRKQNDSTVSDDINQSKINLSTTMSSSNTIVSNSTIKNNKCTTFLDEPQILSNSANGTNFDHSVNKFQHASIHQNNAIESLHNLENDTRRHTSEGDSGLQNRYTGALSEGSCTPNSRCRSPAFVPSFSTLDTTNGHHNGHDPLIDSGKGSSLLTGTSFDVLLNSLKTMREKDLDLITQSSDDNLISVTD